MGAGGQRGGGLSTLLLPLSCLYAGVGLLRQKLATPYRAIIPVICIGNLVAGGTGKTPVALALGKYLKSRGINVHYLSRGYGGQLRGPVKVDSATHGATDVGDEPLLLATVAPTWVSKDRVAGARAAELAGADVILMDDGFQNPGLQKDFSFIVVDAAIGFGNEAVIPAGPLRETIAKGMARADAVILIGVGGETLKFEGIPTYRGHLKAMGDWQKDEGSYVAFAGIGRPGKFFTSLQEAGVKIAARHSFADHHNYTMDDLAVLQAEAVKHSAKLITTEKDWVRLSGNQREDIVTFPVVLDWDKDQSPYELIVKVLSDG